MRMPDFLCIGAQKAGTTWLYENLAGHPELWLPPLKELHYFNELYVPGHAAWTGEHRRTKAMQAFRHHIRAVPEERWNYAFLERMLRLMDDTISDAWYGRIFSAAGHAQLCGDITPEYSLLPRAGISHILRLNPEVRVIFLLRDPIERCWSHIRMLTGKSGRLSIEEAWAFADLRRRSEYPELLSRWRAYLRAERLFVGFTDELAAGPFALLERLCNFLGVPFQASYFPKARQPSHVGEEGELPRDLYESMRAYFEPVYRSLASEFPTPCESWLKRHFG